MGQMTSAIMLGVDAGEAPETYEDEGWDELFYKYEKAAKIKPFSGVGPAKPSGDTDNYNVLGFWVAVGASGKQGCPSLCRSFPLDGFLAVPEYRKAHASAQKRWAKFAAWAKTQGHDFGEPCLWLVMTEVA